MRDAAVETAPVAAGSTTRDGHLGTDFAAQSKYKLVKEDGLLHNQGACVAVESSIAGSVSERMHTEAAGAPAIGLASARGMSSRSR